MANAIEEWNAGVATLMTSRRLTKAQAVRELAISNPALHQAYIAAHNTGARSRATSPAATNHRGPEQRSTEYSVPEADFGGRNDPIAAWEQGVADEMRRGNDRATATRTVASKNPDLRVAYVAAYNSQTPQRRARLAASAVGANGVLR